MVRFADNFGWHYFYMTLLTWKTILWQLIFANLEIFHFSQGVIFANQKFYVKFSQGFLWITVSQFFHMNLISLTYRYYSSVKISERNLINCKKISIWGEFFCLLFIIDQSSRRSHQRICFHALSNCYVWVVTVVG